MKDQLSFFFFFIRRTDVIEPVGLSAWKAAAEPPVCSCCSEFERHCCNSVEYSTEYDILKWFCTRVSLGQNPPTCLLGCLLRTAAAVKPLVQKEAES